MNKFFRINIIFTILIWILFICCLNFLNLSNELRTYIGIFFTIVLNFQCIITSLYFVKNIKNFDNLSKTKWFLCGFLSILSLLDSILLTMTISFKLYSSAIFFKNLLNILTLGLMVYGLYYFINSLKMYSTFRLILRDSLFAFIPITLLMFDNFQPLFISSMYYNNLEINKYIFTWTEQLIMSSIGFLVLILFMASAYIIRCKRSNKILLFLFLFFNSIYYLRINIPQINSTDIFFLDIKYGRIIYCFFIIIAISYNLTDKDLGNEDLLDQYIHINNWWPSIIIGVIPILFLTIYSIATYIFNAYMCLSKFILIIILSILLIIFRDTLVRIDNKNLISTIRKNAKLDPLAKIYNRNAFSEVVESWKNPYTLFFFDLKNFKDINDIYGHNVGDKSIVLVSKFLKEIATTCKKQTAYCRYGGDEFLFAIETCNPEEISSLADEFAKPHYISIQTYNRLCFNMNIGYSINDSNRPLLEILKESDYAMYISKHTQTSSCILYNKSMETEFFRTSILKKDFIASLECEDFYPMFQPKISLTNFKPIGFEALARWNHKELGIISPISFIPIAENSGAIVDLDIYIFRKACNFQKILIHNDIHQQCSVNISLKTLKQINFVETLTKILVEHSLPANIFTLEILENIAIEKNNYIMPKIIQLKSLGFLISIDDFGTDYSSLNRLFLIPFDELKIPKDFVTNLENNRQSIIIESIAYMALKLNINTVVEGIETYEQLGFFKDLGFNSVQGYYFSKPLTDIDYLNYIKENFK